MTRRETVGVPVRGGHLYLTRWPARTEAASVVLAVHGITANSRSWDIVGRCLDGGVTLVAPDLRGRGLSGALPGPYGMDAHVGDLLAVLDFLGISQVTVVGHSMGAFVGCLFAARHPDRVTSVVLVDGGVAFPVPPELDADAALQTIVGPALDRLQMTFPSRRAYREFWQDHPAFRDCWSSDIDTYVQYDLVGTAPQLRSSCNVDAVRIDGRELLVDPDVAAAVHELRCRVVLLWAERGLQNQPQGMYDEERLAEVGLDPARVRPQRLHDVNHYTALLTPAGAQVVAGVILDAAAATQSASDLPRSGNSL
jgi:pimeloyl-ACP methyl ester carboxylesterase